MTGLIIGAALIALLSFGLWLMVRQARKRGAADAIAKGERDARKVENEMTDDVIADKDIDDVLEDLDDGKF